MGSFAEKMKELKARRGYTSGELSERSGVPLGTLNKLLMIYTIIPAAFVVLQAVPVFFYDMVGEKKDKITKELIARREANGTAKAENAEG